MKKILLSLFLSLIIFQPSFCDISLSSYTQNRNLVDDYIDMAKLYTSTAEYEKALEYIDTADKLSPYNPKVLYEKAVILKNYNQPILARNLMHEVAEMDPAYKDTYLYKEFFKDDMQGFYVPKDFNSDYYKNKGEEFYKDGKYEKALDYFIKAVNLKRNAENCNNLGKAYIKMKKPELALKSFEEAQNLDVKNPQTSINLALYYTDIVKDSKKQMHYLKQAIKYNPNLSEPYYLIGNIYFNKGMYETAVEYYRIAAVKDETFIDAQYSLGVSLFNLQKYEEAYLVFEKSLNLELDNPKIYDYLAKSAIILKKFDEAQAYIEREISILPTPSNYLELAKILYFKGDYDRAINLLNTKVSDTKNAQMYNYLGLCYFQKNDYGTAFNYFYKAIALDEKPIYFYNLAVCYNAAQDKSMVDLYVERAKNAKTSEVQDYLDKVKIYLDLNDTKSAISVMDSAIYRFPNERQFYNVKLELLQKSGNSADATILRNTINEKFPKEDVYKGK